MIYGPKTDGTYIVEFNVEKTILQEGIEPRVCSMIDSQRLSHSGRHRWIRYFARGVSEQALTSVRRLAAATAPPCFWPPCFWISMAQLVQGALRHCRRNRLRSERSASALLCGRRRTAGRGR